MLGIFGGTFDPVHYGHLRPALDVSEALKLPAIHFIPCSVPPHREQPVASAEQRLAMLKAATFDMDVFIVDERELKREGISFMVDTLKSLHQDYPGETLCLIIGMDVFLSFHQWQQWQTIPELAHLVVTHRPGWQFDEQAVDSELVAWVEQHKARQISDLEQSSAGSVLFLPVTALDISATHIRRQYAEAKSVRYLLPDAVDEMIRQQHIYKLE